MRMQHRSALIWGLLVASLCATAAGAPPESGDTFLLTNGIEAETGGYLPQPEPIGDYGIDPYAEDPYYGGGAAPGAPAGMLPWPQVSPFDNQFDQHRVQNGLWFNDSNNRGRMWHGGIEGLWMWFQPPHATTRIGLPFPRSDAARTQGQIKDLGVIEELETAGFRPFIGYTNPDDSGFEFNGFFLFESNESNADPDAGTFDRRGEIRLRDAGDMYSTSLIFDDTLHVDYDAQAWGSEAFWLTTPFMSRDKSKLRLLYGVRYFGVDETLNITGVDSSNGTTIISSDVHTELGGPEAGIRWDLGGSSFKIITVAKAGALGAWQRQSLDALNYNGLNTAQENHRAQVVPMIEVGVNLQLPLFQHLPVFKRTPGFRNSMFRVGYSYTGLYLMQRPGNQIDYRDPLPMIDHNPTTLDISGFNFALEWNW